VRVVRGRKLALGTEGEIFWNGPNPFKPVYRNGYNRPDEYERIGLRLDSGEKVFTAGSNVEVIDTVIDESRVEGLAREFAARGHFAALFARSGITFMG
jgi:hypothetical protein